MNNTFSHTEGIFGIKENVLKKLVTILLGASIAFGSALAVSAPASAAPMHTPPAFGSSLDSSNVVQARSDDYNWDRRDRRDWRHNDRRHWRHDDRRYWHNERWREREWRRDRYWRERRGAGIILDF